jgi:hypothetical protein
MDSFKRENGASGQATVGPSRTERKEGKVADIMTSSNVPDSAGGAAASGMQGAAAYTGQQLMDAGIERARYAAAIAPLDPSDSAGRAAAKGASQKRTPKTILEMIKYVRGDDLGPQPGSGGTANRSNPRANAGGAFIRAAGGTLAVLSVAASAYKIAVAEDRPRALARESGGLGGAVGGGVLGAEIGTWIYPGPGTLVGGLIGSAVGGVFGADGGEAIYDYSRQ